MTQDKVLKGLDRGEEPVKEPGHSWEVERESVDRNGGKAQSTGLQDY
jgi:hypothetical protein